MWADAQLNWNDFLPEDEDMNKFVTEQVSSVTAGNTSLLSNIQCTGNQEKKTYSQY